MKKHLIKIRNQRMDFHHKEDKKIVVDYMNWPASGNDMRHEMFDLNDAGLVVEEMQKRGEWEHDFMDFVAGSQKWNYHQCIAWLFNADNFFKAFTEWRKEIKIRPSVGRYKKKPVVVFAIRWTGNNLKDVIAFTGLHESAKKWTWEEYEEVVRKEGLKIFTLEGPLMASIGDMIVRGIAGEFYPCKPDIFKNTYEEIEE